MCVLAAMVSTAQVYNMRSTKAQRRLRCERLMHRGKSERCCVTATYCKGVKWHVGEKRVKQSSERWTKSGVFYNLSTITTLQSCPSIQCKCRETRKKRSALWRRKRLSANKLSAIRWAILRAMGSRHERQVWRGASGGSRSCLRQSQSYHIESVSAAHVTWKHGVRKKTGTLEM